MAFPQTTIAGVSLSRMIIGTNWVAGFSHTSTAADSVIKQKYSDVDSYTPLIGAFVKHGVNAIMGGFCMKPESAAKVLKAEEKLGTKLVIIDTPALNVDDTKEAREECQKFLKRSAEIGTTFCLLHHSSCEKLMNKQKKTMDRLPDYLDMIRQAGLIPGLSAHMPEVLQFSDLNEYDVQTYIQLFNCMGFLMQIEIESVIKIIHKAKKPVMTIKPMAAGRVSPYVGLTFNWNVLRPIDMVTVGCFSPEEAEEDIEISLAAIEHRLPNIGARSSLAPTSIIS
ncbi:MAG: hypothetical protein FWD78_10245 [Treponema sp.]|nr:hypothetical protein [Treponema sp.]